MSAYTVAVLADSPLLYWRLGDSSGTTATDSSGNSRPGTYSGGFTLSSTGAITDGDTAVALNGTTGYVAGPAYTGAFAAAGQRTYEIWYNRTNHSADHALFSASGNNTMLRLASGGQTIKWFPDTTLASANWTSAGPGDGQWVHCVLLFQDAAANAGTAELYINGVSKGKLTGVSTKAPSSNINVGVRGTTLEFFDGSLDEFAVYSGLLSSARILAHYNAGIAAAASVAGPVSMIATAAPAGTLTAAGSVTGALATVAVTAPAGTVSAAASVLGATSPSTIAAPAGVVGGGGGVSGVTAGATIGALPGSLTALANLTGVPAGLTLTALAGIVVAPNSQATMTLGETTGTVHTSTEQALVTIGTTITGTATMTGGDI